VTCNNCSVNGLETFRAKSVEICSMAKYVYAYTSGKWQSMYMHIQVASGKYVYAYTSGK